MNATPRVVGPTSIIEQHSADWPPPAGASWVVLARARTRTESDLIKRWAAGLSAPARPIEVAEDPIHAINHARAADALLVPVTVVWSARSSTQSERSGTTGRMRAWVDRNDALEVAIGVFPQEFASWCQRRMVASRPGQTRLLVGEPARLSALEKRWIEHRGDQVSSSTAEFAGFVERQADIALERLERKFRGERYRRPRAVVGEISSSHGFTDAVSSLADRTGRSPDTLLAEAQEYLSEMASQQQRLAIDLWAGLSRALHDRAYALDVPPDEIVRLRDLINQGKTLVFLLSHRSNLDGYVMSSVAYESGLPPNHVLGGLNMAFWPLGSLGRRAGVIYIRRNIKDNELYRLALKHYIAFLVSRRFNLLWAIEGGRSRTGKLLPPKVGLLNYLAQAVESSGRDNVVIVPTAIVYDFLNEARETTAESRGASKAAEDVRWLWRFARSQRGELGRIHVRFAEPVNLASALSGQMAGSRAPDRRQLALNKVAFEVCDRINRATVLTAPALVSFTLLGAGGRALDLAELRGVISPVLDYVQARDTAIAAEAATLRDGQSLLRTLRAMVENRVLEMYADGPEPVYRIGAEEALVAAFYRNAAIHCFVNRAIAELAVVKAGTVATDEAQAVAFAEAVRLRDLLKFDFFFSERAEFEAEMATEFALLRPTGGWRLQTDSLWPGRDAPQVIVAPRVLRGFLQAYGVVAAHLVDLGHDSADVGTIAWDCLGRGQQYLRQGRVTSAEAVSLHLFETAAKLAAHRDLLRAGDGVVLRRQAFAAELADLLARLEELDRWDRDGRPPAGSELEPRLGKVTS